MYVEKAHPTAPTSAGSGSRASSRKKSHAQSSARRSVKAHVNVHESGTGRKIASHVAGWKTAAPALPRSGLPARMNRFHSGARPFAIDSRTAARHGRFANARSERIGFAAGAAPRSSAGCFHGSIAVVQVDRAVDAAPQDRLAGEDERKQQSGGSPLEGGSA